MINHQVPQEIVLKDMRKKNQGLEEQIYKERLKVLHVHYLYISQGDTESTCVSQQAVNAGWAERWGIGWDELVTTRNEVKSRD